MGTSGYFAYRYEGVYYIKFNRWDSYLEGLGKKLVSYIPEDPVEYEGWLERTRAIIAGFNEAEDAEDESNQAGESSVQILHDQYFEGLHRNEFEYSLESPGTGFGLEEWTYVYDLDNRAFTILDGLHLTMDKIPRGQDGLLWIIHLVYFDLNDGVCICPSPSAPAKYYTSWKSDRILDILAQGMEDMDLYEAIKVDKINPSAWMDTPKDPFLDFSRELSAIAAQGLISGLFSRFSNASELDERSFVTLAKELLTCASPGGAEFSADHDDIYKWSKQIDKGRVDSAEGAGACRLFWFRGCLIVLKRDIDEPTRFKSAVGAVIRHAKKLNLKNCTAILWSMADVAVVQITEDGVSCSEVFGFASAFGVTKVEFKRALGLIAHYLRPPGTHGNPSFDNRLPLDIALRIMAFADVESAAMLGLASKTLRHAWLRAERPTIGPYTLLSVQDSGYFLARNQENNAVNPPVRLAIRYPKCMPYPVFVRHVYHTSPDIQERDRLIYGTGDKLSEGEIEKVVLEVCPRPRFNPEWRDVTQEWKWQLVVVESGPKA